jgi:general secretion pathway protein F
MPLSRALGATNAFPPVMVHLIAGGEATGRLDESLERSARQQQADLSTRLQAAVAVFEPALIVIMGAVVFGIVLAILVPLFNLNQLVGR